MTVNGTLAADQPRQDTTQQVLDRIARHQSAGRFAEAGTLIDRLLAEHGERPRLLHYKGMNLVQTGRAEEGEKLIVAGLKEAPEDPLQLADYGAVLAQSGRLDEAIEQFRAAVEVAPNFGIALSNLGGALVLQKKYGEAVRHLERAVELEGGLLDAHTNLGIAYSQTERFDKAVEVLYKALAIDPQSVLAHLQLSAALYRRERHEAAEHHARRALELAPEAVEAHLHLANALGASGKMEEAAASLLAVAGRPPAGLAALSRLIHLRKTVPGAPELELLERMLPQSEEFPEEGRATLHFAAGKAYDDLKDYERAIANFTIANGIGKALFPFDPATHAARSDRLRNFTSPALVERCRGGGVTDLAPIFITGMPRSGTTLMDQMFSRHPEVQAGGELRAMPQALHQTQRFRQALQEEMPDEEITADDFSQLGEGYVDAVRGEGLRSARISDKMPSNYLYSGLIALALPRARILIMRRHPLDCLLSNYFQNFGRNQPFSTDFANLAAVYRQFDRTARHWAETMPDRVREVRYEDITADAEGQMRDVLAFCELDWSPDVLDYRSSTRQVNTASMAQVREPIYTRSVARWRHYAPHLTELARELSDYLTEEELAACGVS